MQRFMSRARAIDSPYHRCSRPRALPSRRNKIPSSRSVPKNLLEGAQTQGADGMREMDALRKRSTFAINLILRSLPPPSTLRAAALRLPSSTRYVHIGIGAKGRGKRVTEWARCVGRANAKSMPGLAREV